MDSVGLVVVALAVLGYGLVSGRLQSGVVTAPMAFVALGFICGEHGLGLIDLHIGSAFVHVLAEITLVLVLFTDASRINLRALRREGGLPLRLLGIGMPLTILLGAGVGYALMPNLGLWGAAILAAVLAPTDAALGQAVVSNPDLPVRMRQTLNVESGLNDGLALPVLLMLLGAAGATEEAHDFSYWARFTAAQVVLGPLVGAAVGYVSAKLLQRSSRAGWITDAFRSLSVLGVSLAAYGGAELVGGNGFIAAFVAGLTLGNVSEEVCSSLYEFGEAEGQLLTLIVFMIFGASIVPHALGDISAIGIAYCVLSLTAIRMIPVAISLIGSRLMWESVAFLGWFGPRGLASILFALLVVEDSTLPVREQIMSIVMVTVLISVFAHGMTAAPGARRYARRIQPMKEDEGAAEMLEVAEMPVRLPMN